MSTYVINPTTEQEKIITDFLEEQHISFFKEEDDLPDYVLEGIAKAQQDVAEGRFITHEEFKKKIFEDK